MKSLNGAHADVTTTTTTGFSRASNSFATHLRWLSAVTGPTPATMPVPAEPVPADRVRQIGDAPIREDREYVLLWTIAFRRASHNHALDRALEHCRALNKPLLVLEALRVGYPWASDRFHQFVIDGMEHQAEVYDAAGVRYFPYVEPRAGDGAGLLAALSERAAVVVTDDFPCFFLPKMITAAASRLDVALEAVDSNGLYPLRATTRIFTRAHSFRRHLQKELLPHLAHLPNPSPLAEYPHGDVVLDEAITKRWPVASFPVDLSTLAIDHTVTPASFRGGAGTARAQLARFFEERLLRYGDDRSHPDRDASSGLSPWLHFGHISVYEIWRELTANEGFHVKQVGKVNGSREGFWNMSSSAESFIDEFVTWREVGFNMCAHDERYDQLASLPEWALKTIAEHATDERPQVYSLAQLERAETHDPVWNAAQRELVSTGRMQNYLRMLWGKLIYQWSPSAQAALDVMVELNNKYALDGRNPNSYSGIMWVLGRYDRAWGPERPIFGKLRYMTSDSAKRKLRMKRYLTTFGNEQQGLPHIQ